MSSEKARSYLSRIGSRSEADSKEDSLKKPTSPTTNDRPRYTGYKAGEDSTYSSLRKSGLSAPNVARSDSNSLSSMKRNGHTGSQGSIHTNTTSSTTSTTSTGGRYSSSTYIPIGKRLQNSYLSGSTGGLSGSMTVKETEDDKLTTTARREAREAFLRGEAQKYDPSLRERENLSTKTEREKDKERQAHLPTLSHSNHERPSKSGPKEIIADGYVGFANLPNQVYRKAVKRGFEFTLMVVGESGQGKSTLINSMFLTDLYSNEYPGPSHRIKKTVQVETTQVVLKEGGVQLRLTVVDTPGFGDAVDNSNCWQPIIHHIETKYEEYLNSESRVHRKIQPDLRVHCCLYFISPNGHGLKPLDIEFMRRLHDKVNIIPLIAKSDTMTPEECRDFKKTILNEIAQHKIRIYEFPDGEDEEENKMQKRLKDRVPFAVVGSNAVVESGGKKVRGRVYPWGTVEVENLEHNDFIALRNMLIRTHMQDLKDVTNNVHYENYRYNMLATVGQDGKSKGSGKFLSSPVAALRKKKLGRSHSANPVSPLSSLSHPLYNNALGRSPSQRSVHSLQELSPNLSHPMTDSDTSSIDFGDSNLLHNTSSVGVQVTTRLLSPLLQLDEERREHEAKMKKMEAEMQQVFEMKVKEKRNKLKESEADLQKKTDQMTRIQEQQERDLEERQLAFEKERKIWEEQEKHITEQMRTLEKEKTKKKGIF